MLPISRSTEILLERTPEQRRRNLLQQARGARIKASRLREQAVEMDAEAERLQAQAEAI